MSANQVAEQLKTGKVEPYDTLGFYNAVMNSFKSAIEAAPKSRETAESWLATQWRSKVENGGEPLKGWQRTHNTWMAKPEVQAAMDYFPGLRERIELAAEKSKTVDEMAARFDDALKQAKAESKAKQSEIQKMAKEAKERRITQTGLRHFVEEQKDPAKVIDAFMKSNSRMNDEKIIGDMVKADKHFKEDMKGAFKDHINRLDSDAQRLAYIQDADNQKLITDLFGKEMTARLNDVAESIHREGLVKPSDIKAEMMDVKQGWLRGSMGTMAAYFTGGFKGAVGKVAAERVAEKYMRLPEKMAQVRVKAALEPKEAARLLAKTQVPKTALTANIPKTGGALIPRMGKEQDNSEDTVDERIRRVLEGRK